MRTLRCGFCGATVDRDRFDEHLGNCQGLGMFRGTPESHPPLQDQIVAYLAATKPKRMRDRLARFTRRGRGLAS